MTTWVPIASAHELWLIVQLLGILFLLCWLALWMRRPCSHRDCYQHRERLRITHRRLILEDQAKREAQAVEEAHRWHNPQYPIKTCRLCPGGGDQKETQ